MSSRPPAEDRSLGAVVRDLVDDIRTLIRSEIALAKLEIRNSIAGVGGAAGMFTVAGFMAAIAGLLLIVTLILVLALWMPAWVATLIVAILLLAGAGALVFAGKNRLQRTAVVPAATIESVRTDLEAMRGSARRDLQ